MRQSQDPVSTALTGKKKPSKPQALWRWFDARAVWLLPLLAWLAYWWPVVWGQSQLFARDLTFYAYPLKTFMMERLWEGEFPFWTPYLSNGMPFFAELSNQVLYPLNILYWLTPNAVQGLSWQITLEHLIGFWTMGYLARKLGFSKWTSIWISLAYGFSGYVLGITDNINYHPAVAWAPLALAFFVRGIQRIYMEVSLPWGWLLGQSSLTAIALSLMLIAGDTFNCLFLGIFCTSSVIALSILWLRQYKRRALVPTLQLWSHWALSFGLVFGICAVQVLPSWELMQLSVRQEMLAYGEVTLWSFPWERLIEFAVPYFYGSRFPEPHFIGMFMYPAFREPWADSVYVGFLTLFFAVLGIFYSKVSFRWFWVWMAILAVLLAAGGNALYYPVLVKLLPILQTQRYLEKFIFFTSIAFPILAGYGIHAFTPCFERSSVWLSEKKLAAKIGMSIGIFVCLNLMFIQLPAQAWIWPHYFERSMDWGAHFYERGLHVVGLYWHFCVLLLPLMVLLWVNRTVAPIYLGILLTLGIADLATVHYSHMPTTPSSLLIDRPTPIIAKALKRAMKQTNFKQPTGPVRVYYDDMKVADETEAEKRSLDAIALANQLPYLSDPYFFQWIYRVHYNQERLLFNYGIAYGTAYQNGRFAPLQPKLHKQMDLVLTEKSPETLMELSNVHYIITPIHFANAVWERHGYREVFRDPGYNVKLIAVDHTVPRAYVAPNPLWNTEPQGVYFALTDAVQQHPKTQWAELSPIATIKSPITQGRLGEVNWKEIQNTPLRFIKHTPEAIEISVTSPYTEAKPLVLTEAWFPGWRATLDHKKALPVFLANHRFLSVMLPPGKHTVRFEYQSTYFFLGLWISLGTLLWAGLTILWRKLQPV